MKTYLDDDARYLEEHKRGKPEDDFPLTETEPSKRRGEQNVFIAFEDITSGRTLQALARKKVIKSRRGGTSFDPEKKLKIPSLIHPSEWDGDIFKEFRQKVDQARIVIFTVLPGVDDPDDPDTMVLTSLWGEVL